MRISLIDAGRRIAGVSYLGVLGMIVGAIRRRSYGVLAVERYRVH